MIERIREAKLIAVVDASSPDEALRVVNAIREGGISLFEIPLTVGGAVGVIRRLVESLGDDALIGAGTVLDADAARECIDSGAQFIGSPGLDIPTIDCCDSIGIPVFPGALTPTEVITAWKAHASGVKIFPAGAVGGPAYIKSLKASLPQVELVPTGGVTPQNAAEFIAAGALAVGVGADLVKGTPAEITAKARQYAAAV